jgi:hypothetical protein
MADVAGWRSYPVTNFGIILAASSASSALPLQISLFKLKNGIFRYVTPSGSCKNRRFGGTFCNCACIREGFIVASFSPTGSHREPLVLQVMTLNVKVWLVSANTCFFLPGFLHCSFYFLLLPMYPIATFY